MGCSLPKPLPVAIGGICSSSTDLIASCKKLVTAEKVGVNEVSGVIAGLSGFVDAVCDLFESLNQGNQVRQIVTGMALITKLASGIKEDVPVPEETILRIVVASLDLVKNAIKITAKFVSDFKTQLDLAAKGIEEALKPIKEDLNGKYGEKQTMNNIQKIAS